jgi:hypothetical protein
MYVIGIGKGIRRTPSPGWVKRLAGCMLLLGVLAVASGCAHMTLTVKANYDTNRGNPVYVLVRSVNEKAFLTESYQDVIGIVFKDPPDPSILAYQVIVPGQKQKLRVEKPADTPIGVYCLYTEPDEQWKMMLPQPLHSRYLILLEKNRITEKMHE